MVVCPKCCIGNLIEESFSMEKIPNCRLICDICDYQEDEFGRII